MSAEKAILERWTGYKPLEDLLPASRIQSGTGKGAGAPTLPYGSLENAGLSKRTRTTNSIVEDVTLKLHLYGGDLDALRAIAVQMEQYFGTAGNGSFDYSLGSILDMRKGDQSEKEGPDHVWEIVLPYRVMTRQLR